METTEHIFYQKIGHPTPAPIKTIPIDWNVHSKGIIALSRSIEPNFQITQNNKEVLKLMLQYFTGNQKFIEKMKLYSGVPGSFTKGIMIIGSVGCGKSLLFRVFKEYTKHILQANGFQYQTAIDIIDNVNIVGVEYLNKFSHNKGKPIRLYIDDIASRNETVKNYGTEINVIEQLLSLRYNVFEMYDTLTYCTSNKFPAQLKEIYDERIVDRMKEMFNIIELKGNSFRK